MNRPISDTERRAIEAIRAYSAEKVLSSAEGYALTVGRLCELALAHNSASSEQVIEIDEDGIVHPPKDANTPQPSSEAVENALDAVRRAFGSDWTPEQGEAMDKLTDTVRASIRATPQPAIEKGTPRTDALSNKFWHELRLAGELTFEQEAKIFARHVREAEKLALELERELVTTRWELNERRGLDKAREEDRLAVRAALRAGGKVPEGWNSAPSPAPLHTARPTPSHTEEPISTNAENGRATTQRSIEQPHEAPTPRTDAEVVYGSRYPVMEVVDADFARQLEWELAQAIERERLANMRADQAEEARDAARYRARREHAYFLGRTDADNIDYEAFRAAYDAASDAAMQSVSEEKP